MSACTSRHCWPAIGSNIEGEVVVRRKKCGKEGISQDEEESERRRRCEYSRNSARILKVFLSLFTAVLNQRSL